MGDGLWKGDGLWQGLPQLHVRNYTCPPLFSACLHAIAAVVSRSCYLYLCSDSYLRLFVCSLISLFVYLVLSRPFLARSLYVLAARFMFCQTEFVSCILVGVGWAEKPKPRVPASFHRIGNWWPEIFAAVADFPQPAKLNLLLTVGSICFWRNRLRNYFHVLWGSFRNYYISHPQNKGLT